jgi:hypothetical protein
VICLHDRKSIPYMMNVLSRLVALSPRLAIIIAGLVAEIFLIDGLGYSGNRLAESREGVFRSDRIGYARNTPAGVDVASVTSRWWTILASIIDFAVAPLRCSAPLHCSGALRLGAEGDNWTTGTLCDQVGRCQ